MSAPKKLRGNTQSEVTRLKKLWLGWSDAEREAWRSLFSSDTTQADIRQRLKVEVGIALKHDNQLTSFRSWMAEQDARDAEAERQQIEETQLREQHPDWDAERLRSEVIAGSLRRALVSGDFKGLGLKAVKAGQQEKVISLDREKFELMKRKADAYDRAQSAIADAKQAPGGITPETLEKIERELKLL